MGSHAAGLTPRPTQHGPFYDAALHDKSLTLDSSPENFHERMVEPLYYDRKRSLPGRVTVFNTRIALHVVIRTGELAATLFIGMTSMVHESSRFISRCLITLPPEEVSLHKTAFDAVKRAGEENRFLLAASCSSLSQMWEQDSARFGRVRANSGMFSTTFSAHLLEAGCRYTLVIAELFLMQIASIMYVAVRGGLHLDQKLITDITNSDYQQAKLAAHNAYVDRLMKKLKTAQEKAFEKELQTVRGSLAKVDKSKASIQARIKKLDRATWLSEDEALAIKDQGPDVTPVRLKNAHNLCFWHSYLQTTFHQALFHTDLLNRWDDFSKEIETLKASIRTTSQEETADLSLKEQIAKAATKAQEAKAQERVLERIEQLSIFLHVASQYLKALSPNDKEPKTIACPIPGLNRSRQEDLEQAHNQMDLINDFFRVNTRLKTDSAFLANIIRANDTSSIYFKQLKAFCASQDKNNKPRSFTLRVNDTDFLINTECLESEEKLVAIRDALNEEEVHIAICGNAPRVDHHIQVVPSFKEIFTSDSTRNRLLFLLKEEPGRAILSDHMNEHTTITVTYGRNSNPPSVTLTKANLTETPLSSEVNAFIEAVRTQSQHALNLTLTRVENDVDSSPIGEVSTLERMHTPFTLRSIVSDDDGELTSKIKREDFERLVSMNAIGHNVRTAATFVNDSSPNVQRLALDKNISYADCFAVLQADPESMKPNSWQLDAGPHVLIAAQVFEDYPVGQARSAKKMAIPQLHFDAFGRHFELESFAKHRGASINGGHWIAYRKVGGQWYELDDCCDNTPKTEEDIKALLKSNGNRYQIQHTFYSLSELLQAPLGSEQKEEVM